MTDRVKVLNPFTTHYRGNVYVTVKYDGKRLSLTGVEGPKANGNCRGGCGQIDMHLRAEDRAGWTYHPGWDDEVMDMLLEVWDIWHLNDMNAGTRRQTAIIEEYKRLHPQWRYDYIQAKAILSEMGADPDYGLSNHLQTEQGYRYGHAWLHEPVPETVIEWLFSLPDNRYTPAWH